MEIPEINERVDEILNDRISGASAISRKAAECLDVFAGWVIENVKDIPPNRYLKELISVGQELIRAQPTMAAVINVVNDIISSTKNEYDQLEAILGHDYKKQLKYLCTYTQSGARKCILESRLALETIAKSYEEVIKDNNVIMTISASSAVEASMIEAFNNGLEFIVYTPESRPMYEGRLMAQRLAEKGIKTVLTADHAMFHFLKECSSIIVGADRVMPNGIMNKIGTYGLAIAAKDLKIPFYCICQRMKFIPSISPQEDLIIDQPEAQLYSISRDEKKPEELNVKNIYFDFTPIKYVTRFLTEEGLVTTKQVKDYIKTLKVMPELVAELSSL
jgi:translation initiation factor eIF-2B subunit delta